MVNRTILQGRLTRDPEYFPEKKYARYTLACGRNNGKSNKGKADKEEADFIECVTFNGGAEWADKYLKQGTMIIVEGSIRTSKYENQDGKKVKTTSVVVEQHHFCESKKAEGFAAINTDVETDGFEDLPFV